MNCVFPAGETHEEENDEEVAPANLRGFIAAKQTRPNPGNGGNIIDVVERRRLEGIHAVGHLEGKGGGVACDEEGEKRHEKEGIGFIQLQWKENPTSYARIGFLRPGRKKDRKRAVLNPILISAQNPTDPLQLPRGGKLENRSHSFVHQRQLLQLASRQQSLKRPRNDPHNPFGFRGDFRQRFCEETGCGQIIGLPIGLPIGEPLDTLPHSRPPGLPRRQQTTGT